MLKVTLSCLFACLVLEGHGFVTKGAEWRVPESRQLPTPARLRAQESAHCEGTDRRHGANLGTAPNDPLVTCLRQRNKDKVIYVFGDSHARHLLPGLSELYPDHTIAVLYFTSCPVQSGLAGYVYQRKGKPVLTQACNDRNQKAMTFFATQAPTTILLHQYGGYAGDGTEPWYAASRHLVQGLEAMGHSVIWVGAVVYPSKLLTDCVTVPRVFSDAHLARRCRGEPQSIRFVYDFNAQLSQRFPQTYVDTNPFFCPSGTVQSCRLVKGGVPLFRDAHHLTPAASIALLKAYRDQIEKRRRRRLRGL